MTYSDSLHRIKRNTNPTFWNTEDIEHYNNIVNAIEKQIPKFVLCPKGFQGIRDTRYYCPACNSLTRQHEAFCHKCGQAVKYPKEVYNKTENKIVLDWSDTV